MLEMSVEDIAIEKSWFVEEISAITRQRDHCEIQKMAVWIAFSFSMFTTIG